MSQGNPSLPDYDTLCKLVGRLFIECHTQIQKTQANAIEIAEQLQQERVLRTEAEAKLRELQARNGSA